MNVSDEVLVSIIKMLAITVFEDDILTVNNLLKLIPEGQNKKFITELIFIFSCCEDKKIINPLIAQGININCLHTFKSLKGWGRYMDQIHR